MKLVSFMDPDTGYTIFVNPEHVICVEGSCDDDGMDIVELHCVRGCVTVMGTVFEVREKLEEPYR